MTNKELFNDYVLKFKEWLASAKKLKKSTISARIANIRTVGEHYDILEEFLIDECQGVLEDLHFSANDDEPKTSIVIRGNYYNGLATYRQVVRLFIEFLNAINYSAPVISSSTGAKFIGSFDEFKRYVGPKCRNEVNIFCKSEREARHGICEYCGQKHVLQSAHIKERPVIIKEILDNNYKIGSDLYEINLEDFFIRFKNSHLPIKDHIFFLCKECHDKLDKEHSITITDIKNKRSVS
jgi:hypothetical protein